MLEKVVEKEVVDYAKERGVDIVIKLNGEGNRGKPDHMFIYKGEVLVVEFKRLGQKPTKGQTRWLERFRLAGCRAHWVDNPAEGMDLIDQLVEDNEGL